MRMRNKHEEMLVKKDVGFYIASRREAIPFAHLAGEIKRGIDLDVGSLELGARKLLRPSTDPLRNWAVIKGRTPNRAMAKIVDFATATEGFGASSERVRHILWETVRDSGREELGRIIGYYAFSRVRRIFNSAAHQSVTWWSRHIADKAGMDAATSALFQVVDDLTFGDRRECSAIISDVNYAWAAGYFPEGDYRGSLYVAASSPRN